MTLDVTRPKTWVFITVTVQTVFHIHVLSVAEGLQLEWPLYWKHWPL